MRAGNEGRIRPSFIAAFFAVRVLMSPTFNEGRIRPSFIAASDLSLHSMTSPYNEGRIRPSFIAAGGLPGCPGSVRTNEGRIRPSFIAALTTAPGPPDFSCQRGSNSTLLHCGRAASALAVSSARATRVEFDPPSLRRNKHQSRQSR